MKNQTILTDQKPRNTFFKNITNNILEKNNSLPVKAAVTNNKIVKKTRKEKKEQNKFIEKQKTQLVAQQVVHLPRKTLEEKIKKDSSNEGTQMFLIFGAYFVSVFGSLSYLDFLNIIDTKEYLPLAITVFIFWSVLTALAMNKVTTNRLYNGYKLALEHQYYYEYNINNNKEFEIALKKHDKTLEKKIFSVEQEYEAVEYLQEIKLKAEEYNSNINIEESVLQLEKEAEQKRIKQKNIDQQVNQTFELLQHVDK